MHELANGVIGVLSGLLMLTFVGMMLVSCATGRLTDLIVTFSVFLGGGWLLKGLAYAMGVPF